MQMEDLFREKPLERLASPPEQLEATLHLLRPSHWLLLTGLALLIATGLGWSVLGRIPVMVSGRGVILRPLQVTSIQSSASGLIGRLDINVGDRVKAGDVLGAIEQPALRKQIELEKAKLKELQEDSRSAAARRAERQQMERRFNELQRKEIQVNMQEMGELAEKVRSIGLKSIETQRESYQKLIQRNEELLKSQKERLERIRELQRLGYAASETVTEAEASVFQVVNRLVDLDLQTQQLTVQAAQTETAYLEKLHQITALRERLRMLDLQEQKIVQEDVAATAVDERQLHEIERSIARLESDLATQGRIVSEHTGRILEITVRTGQVVSAGTRLGALEIENSTQALICLSYFAVKDGKLLKDGTPVQITLDTVKQERFGCLLGTVKSVSSFPVSAESAAHVIGNQQLAAELTAQFRQIQVIASLRPDARTPSGFAWSSGQGPTLIPTAGTTATISAIVEERAPITFLFPSLRSNVER
jgi:HlyD family secretion protein